MQLTKHIVLVSGGKDSSAMLIRMIELNMQIDKIVFCNTTLEYPDMYLYLKKLEKYIGREIIWVTPKKRFDDWFYGKYLRGKHQGRIRGMPTVIGHSYCCREFKVNPMIDFDTDKNILYLGIAKGEENRIQKNPNRHYPLIEWGWTEQKCLDFLREKEMLNPLYKHLKRTGCWLCPKQSKESLRFLFEHYPVLWRKLLQYEKDSPIGFHHIWKLTDLENEWKYQTKLLKCH